MTETYTTQLFSVDQLATQPNQVGLEVRKAQKMGDADDLLLCGLTVRKPSAGYTND
ncbi:hypothetical protein [Rosistilla oblonga]|uniref:hypothetical protein n=1 Tax=Rosistilla oblonga TaxID=2527990 RepID=UPI003A979C61